MSSLDQLYAGAFADLLMGRADRALAATGFDALVVHAGLPADCNSWTIRTIPTR